MPSQFRSFSSAADSSPESPDNSEVTSSNLSSNGDHPAIAPQAPEPDAKTTPAFSETVEERSIASGLHEVVKSTDFWFNLELSLLEKYAVTSAGQWAQAGIPRQDAPLEGELPIETTLRARASEIFQEWIARIE